MLLRQRVVVAPPKAAPTPNNVTTRNTTNTVASTTALKTLQWTPSSREALGILLAVRWAGVWLAPLLSDCDETFNYWEQVHYLQYGYGWQTWEYAPHYALRSWLYIVLHALPAQLLGTLLSLALPSAYAHWNKMLVLYCVQTMLASVCAWLEMRLYRAVVECWSPRIGCYLLVMLCFSPGMFLASAALLPSSFAMYTTLLAYAHAISNNSPQTTSRWGWFHVPIFYIGLGALWGWPFSAVVGLPLALEYLVPGVVGWTKLLPRQAWWRMGGALLPRRTASLLATSALSLAVLLIPQLLLDSSFYQRWTVAPWNLVSYNVLRPSQDAGPDIFGREPWHFYLRNGVLNFNLVFPLALFSLPILLLTYLLSYRYVVAVMNVAFLAGTMGRPYTVMVLKLLPGYLWLLVFTLQPHKEERFLFVVYPLLCLNAAVALTFLRVWVQRILTAFPSNLVMSKVPAWFSTATLVLFSLLGISRILALTIHYGAPIPVYSDLSWHISASHPSPASRVHVCVGAEWYRFPSHYFLPEQARVVWLDEGFSGLLPIYFAQQPPMQPADSDSSPSAPKVLLFPWSERNGTYQDAHYFNHRNQAIPKQFVYT